MEQLVERLKQREEAALEKLMDELGDYFYRMAFLLIKDRFEAEEVVQDLFILCFEQIDSLREPSKLKSWLTTIVVNLCRKRLRKWSFRHIFLRTNEEEMDEAANVNIEKEVLQIELTQQLTAHIRSLDYKYRETLTLYYFGDYPVSEISAILEMKENTVKSNLARGRKLLKERLESEPK
ncbi:RNA polymerase sigma factor [Bacillus alkalicellulosilyticus]|uniref:RNA polymerase sigma factor n=1 Tax=Alkalihalobacterium alkalicellulosilyticum TaxID=1912214 RepID=UPI0009971510|nr:sigma-70 family RNA polymerase sigma factor [Bacillus alkalicellulosilyticus]